MEPKFNPKLSESASQVNLVSFESDNSEETFGKRQHGPARIKYVYSKVGQFKHVKCHISILTVFMVLIWKKYDIVFIDFNNF